MQTLPTSQLPISKIIKVADLPTDVSEGVVVAPGRGELDATAEFLGIVSASKTRLDVHLKMERDGRVTLRGTLGATVVQTCVVTLQPVRTRIDEPVERYFVPDLPDYGEDHQMSEDEDTMEMLGETIDLGAVLIENLALALPQFPRSKDAQLDQHDFSAPGTAPMTDDDAKPFASLAVLKDRLKDGGSTD